MNSPTGGGRDTPIRRSNRIRKAKQSEEEKEKEKEKVEDAGQAPQSPRPWTLAEVEIFFHGLHQHGTAWKKIASELKNRTPEMVQSLYETNKGYLSLPADMTSATALYTIIKDKENSLHRLSTETVSTQPAATGQSTKKFPKPQPALQKQTAKKVTSKKNDQAVQASPEPKRTRKQLFPDSPPSATTTRKKGSPATPVKRAAASTTKTTPKRSKQTRAKTPTRGKSPVSDALPPKLRDKCDRGKMSYSPSPHALPNKRKRMTIAESHSQIATSIQERLGNFFSTKKTLKWCMYEWFYSDLDRPFFEYSDFRQCLKELNLPNVKRLSRVEWGYLRSVMGRPRRFSAAFLQDERAKLQRYRENIREMRVGGTPVHNEIYPPLSEIFSQLAVGTRVLVVHPRERELQPGTIVGVEHAHYRIEFANPQLNDNDSVLVSDTEVMAHETDTTRSPASTPIRLDPAQLSPCFSDDDLQSMINLLRLLDRKEKIIAELRALNDEAEKMTVKEPTDNFSYEFQRKYASLVLYLANINQLLEPTLLYLHSSKTPQQSSRVITPGPSASYSSPSSSPTLTSSTTNKLPLPALFQVASAAIQSENFSPPDDVYSASRARISRREYSPSPSISISSPAKTPDFRDFIVNNNNNTKNTNNNNNNIHNNNIHNNTNNSNDSIIKTNHKAYPRDPANGNTAAPAVRTPDRTEKEPIDPIDQVRGAYTRRRKSSDAREGPSSPPFIFSSSPSPPSTNTASPAKEEDRTL